MAQAQAQATSSAGMGDAEAQAAVQEATSYYKEVGNESDLREPHRIPQRFVRGIFDKEAPTLPPAPVIAFINSRSGGRAGPELSVALRRALGTTQVFDLGTHRPDKVLKKLWANFEEHTATDEEADHLRHSLRILTAGGDGTVAWVLQTIARLELQPPPSVAVIPLGTGNDLSRSFGWGPAFTKAWIKGHKALHKTLGRIAGAEPVPLDRWRVTMTAPNASYFKTKRPYGFVPVGPGEEASSYSAESWNYISVGMDAKAAQGFHHLRDTRPGLAFSRAANQFWYGWFSCKSGWFCGAQALNKRLTMEVLREGQWRDAELDSSVKAIVLLNLQSYGGGRNLWGKHDADAQKAGLLEPSNADGLLEVVAFKSGYHAGVVMAGGMHAVRIAQAAGVRMRVRGTKADAGESMGTAFIQLDGEPWKQNVPAGEAPEADALIVEVTYQGHSRMLLSPGFPGSPAPAAAAATVTQSAPPPAREPVPVATQQAAGVEALPTLEGSEEPQGSLPVEPMHPAPPADVPEATTAPPQPEPLTTQDLNALSAAPPAAPEAPEGDAPTQPAPVATAPKLAMPVIGPAVDSFALPKEDAVVTPSDQVAADA